MRGVEPATPASFAVKAFSRLAPFASVEVRSPEAEVRRVVHKANALAAKSACNPQCAASSRVGACLAQAARFCARWAAKRAWRLQSRPTP